MASPQVEEGHVRIANELLEALMLAGLTAHQWTVTWAVIRKTYGWGQKVDDIALSQLVALTGMDKSNVSRAIKSLVERRIVSRADGKYGHVLGLNKNHRQWIEVVKSTAPKPTKPERVVESTTQDGEHVAQAVAAEGSTVVESTIHAGVKVVDSTTPVEGDLFGDGVVDSETQGCQIGNASVVESTTTKDTYTKDTTTKAKPFAHSLRNEHFDAFWSSYPKKVGKKVARKAFDKVNPDAELLATMLAALDVHKKSRDWARGFIHDPATWLNGERWNDVIQTTYTTEQKAVIDAFNASLGNTLGVIDAGLFVSDRAAVIDDMLSRRPNDETFAERYFAWVKEQQVKVPDSAGFDWLISRKGFSSVTGGQHSKRDGDGKSGAGRSARDMPIPTGYTGRTASGELYV